MSVDIFDNLFGVEEEVDEKYTAKVDIPQYLPKNEKPSVHSLCNTYKYEQLMSEIKAAKIPEEEKQFLYLAAARHIVFNYSKIADYYAHSTKTTQELMEKSALIILDIDDAIANGYIKLSKNIEKIMRETGRLANTSLG
jgi:hypothetical protein